MAGYPGLSRITDPATRDTVKKLFDLVSNLQAQITALEAAAVQKSGSIDAGGLRVVNVADPTSEQDVVTKHYLQRYVEGQAKVL